MNRSPIHPALPWLGAVLGLAVGCTKVESYDATEQFLLSQAASEATEQVSPQTLRGRAVYIEDEFMSVPSESRPAMQYMIGEFRTQVLLAGGRLVQRRDEAQIIVEPRTGGIGTDHYQFLVGVPQIPIGTLAQGTGMPSVPITTPELALIKNTRQLSTASIAYVAYWADTGEILASSGPFVGQSFREDWWFFGWGPRSLGDIPTIEELE